jgi:hypothetical protein
MGYTNFVNDMGEPPAGLTLDRFPNNDGNYEPGNCRWATWAEQAETRSKTGPAPDPNSIRGKARAAGLPYMVVYLRMRVLGWTEERALTTPKGHRFPRGMSESEKARLQLAAINEPVPEKVAHDSTLVAQWLMENTPIVTSHPQTTQKKCTWAYSVIDRPLSPGIDNMFSTGCGSNYTFLFDGDPVKNRLRDCPICCGRIYLRCDYRGGYRGLTKHWTLWEMTVAPTFQSPDHAPTDCQQHRATGPPRAFWGAFHVCVAFGDIKGACMASCKTCTPLFSGGTTARKRNAEGAAAHA